MNLQDLLKKKQEVDDAIIEFNQKEQEKQQKIAGEKWAKEAGERQWSLDMTIYMNYREVFYKAIAPYIPENMTQQELIYFILYLIIPMIKDRLEINPAVVSESISSLSRVIKAGELK